MILRLAKYALNGSGPLTFVAIFIWLNFTFDIAVLYSCLVPYSYPAQDRLFRHSNQSYVLIWLLELFIHSDGLHRYSEFQDI